MISCHTHVYAATVDYIKISLVINMTFNVTQKSTEGFRMSPFREVSAHLRFAHTF